MTRTWSRRTVRASAPGLLVSLRRHLARRERLFVFAVDSSVVTAWGDRSVPGITVRPITPADAVPLTSLTPPHETLERLVLGDLGVIAEDEAGRPVGCTWLARRDMAAPHHVIAVRPGPGEAYGYGLRVEPGMRRRGIGKALMVASRRRALEQGLNRVMSHVEFANDASLALQRSVGAVPVKQLYTIVFFDRLSLILKTITPDDAAS